MKKFLLFIILVMTFPMTMKAVQVVIDGIKYVVVTNEKKATVIPNSPVYTGDIVIPESIEFEGVTCYVKSIAKEAFCNCSSLTSITIPNSVTSIGENAFKNCSLRKVIVSDIAAWCNISFGNYLSNPLYYAHHLYSDENTEITNLIIPEGVTSIMEYCFAYCSSLSSINIPNSVTSIGGGAFRDCSSLTSITIPNSVTSIEQNTFYGCTSLTSIDIPNSVTSIGGGAFRDCSSLTSITIPNSVTSIEQNTFYGCTSLTSVNIPNSVTSIGDFAFFLCGFTSIDIPNSVTSISSSFQACRNLKSIKIPNSVKSLGNAFYNCTGLESVEIGDGVPEISNYTFFFCNSLRNVTLGKNVSKILYNNFVNCVDLEVVTCKNNNPPKLVTFDREGYKDPFKGSFIEYAKLVVPDESIDAYKAAKIWRDFGTIEGLSGNILETEKCATPTIHYANGQLTFECETEGVKFQTSITNPDVGSYNTNTINLGGTYYVKVYATKPEYEDSDVATIEINLLEGSGPAIKGDVDNDGYVNMMDVTKIINIILGKEQ